MQIKHRQYKECVAESTSPYCLQSLADKDDYGGGTKRIKVSGLNSRFDRMIEEMNATHRSPTKSGPRRTRTVSSSSIGTSDPPRTPLDAYSGLKEGRLGKDFALIKMNTPSQVYDKTVTSSTHMEVDFSSGIGVRVRVSNSLLTYSECPHESHFQTSA